MVSFEVKRTVLLNAKLGMAETVQPSNNINKGKFWIFLPMKISKRIMQALKSSWAKLARDRRSNKNNKPVPAPI